MLQGAQRNVHIPPLIANSRPAAITTPSDPTNQQQADREVRLLEISTIRRDGGTQHRVISNPALIAQYAELMSTGAEFPPITVWFDGSNCWVSDGFQRIAACERIDRRQIPAEIRMGTQGDAQWHSYRANSDHGRRRTRADVRVVVQGALQHPKAAVMSNMEIARHLNLPEATLRRWRKTLSSSSDEDTVRIVTRGQSTYLLDTSSIGKRHMATRPKSRRDLAGCGKTLFSPNGARRINKLATTFGYFRRFSAAC